MVKKKSDFLVLEGKGLMTSGDTVWVNVVVLLTLLGLLPKLVWCWVYLLMSYNADKELKLLCNILGVLFLTNFKSHLKKDYRTSNQN